MTENNKNFIARWGVTGDFLLYSQSFISDPLQSTHCMVMVNSNFNLIQLEIQSPVAFKLYPLRNYLTIQERYFLNLKILA